MNQRICPECGRRFDVGGWEREYGYQQHTCLPRLMGALRSLRTLWGLL
jgi:hypothetical protein